MVGDTWRTLRYPTSFSGLPTTSRATGALPLFMMCAIVCPTASEGVHSPIWRNLKRNTGPSEYINRVLVFGGTVASVREESASPHRYRRSFFNSSLSSVLVGTVLSVDSSRVSFFVGKIVDRTITWASGACTGAASGTYVLQHLVR